MFLINFLHFLENIRTEPGTAFFSFMTLFGEEIMMIAVLCLLYWCVDKKLGYRMSFAYFLSGLCVQSLKITFRVSRPWVLDPTLSPVPSALDTATGYSFPSGHTQSATTLFGSMALYLKKRGITIFCAVMIGFVALSRMYLGVHTPKDVIVSFLVSGLLVYAAGVIFRKREQNKSKSYGSKKIFWFIFAVSGCVILYALFLLQGGWIMEIYASDCCKAAGAGLGFALGWWIEETYIQFDEKGFKIVGQIIKYVIGISIAIALKFGLKAILGESIPAGILRYFLLVLWVTVGFPYFVKLAMRKKKKTENETKTGQLF